MLRWFVIIVGTFGFYVFVSQSFTDSHHTAFVLANSYAVSWAAIMAAVCCLILWMRVRTK